MNDISQIASKTRQIPGYRPDIDGLRAIAVLAVVLFHAEIPGFTGGYVGVDVFYVISGYLIASLIVRELSQGRFSFVSFYERRIRRIFPALLCVLLVSSLVAVCLLPPRELADFSNSLMAATTFLSNIFFERQGLRQGTGYFDGNSNLQPLLHTWSLSVEEQFYIIFPVILVFLYRLGRKAAVICLFLAAVVSFWFSHQSSLNVPQVAFYVLPSRIWELLLGALFAIQPLYNFKSRIIREFECCAGLILIGCSIYFLKSWSVFPGTNALLPCLGACLVIHSGQATRSRLSAALSCMPLVFIGLISYSLYLWSWPVLAFSRYISGGWLDSGEKWGALAGSLLLATVSYRLIESPFRGEGAKLKRQKVFQAGLAASVFLFALGFIVHQLDGLPQRYNAQAHAIIAGNTERKTEIAPYPCDNWGNKIRSLEDINFCKIEPEARTKIMFLGDSHMSQWFPLVKSMHANGNLYGKGAIFAVAPGCQVALRLNNPNGNYYCDLFTRYAIERAVREDIDTVFIASSAWWSFSENSIGLVEEGRHLNILSRDVRMQYVLEDLSLIIRTLKNSGKQVIVSLPFAIYGHKIPDSLIREASLGIRAPALYDNVPTDLRSGMASVAASSGARVFDASEILCRDGKCLTQIDGISIYSDNNHLATSQIGMLRDAFEKSLFPERAMDGPPNGERCESFDATIRMGF